MKLLVLATMLCLVLTGSLMATQASDYEVRGDKYMEEHRYRVAAATYKIALKYAPSNNDLWEKHRVAIESGKSIEIFVNRGKELLKKGFIEDAGAMFQQAVKLDPRNETLWRLYENTLIESPHVAVIRSERDAWMVFKQGRGNFDKGHYQAARRMFAKVAETTTEEKLLYYARDYLKKTDERLRDFHINEELRTFHP
jgi:tetratricopeptide (TPR) repeat protein